MNIAFLVRKEKGIKYSISKVTKLTRSEFESHLRKNRVPNLNPKYSWKVESFLYGESAIDQLKYSESSIEDLKELEKSVIQNPKVRKALESLINFTREREL